MGTENDITLMPGDDPLRHLNTVASGNLAMIAILSDRVDRLRADVANTLRQVSMLGGLAVQIDRLRADVTTLQEIVVADNGESLMDSRTEHTSRLGAIEARLDLQSSRFFQVGLAFFILICGGLGTIIWYLPTLVAKLLKMPVP